MKKTFFAIITIAMSTTIISWVTKGDNIIHKNYEEITHVTDPSKTQSESSMEKVEVTIIDGVWLDNGAGDIECQKEGKCMNIVITEDANNYTIVGDPASPYYEITADPGYNFTIISNDGIGGEILATHLLIERDGEGVGHVSID